MLRPIHEIAHFVIFNWLSYFTKWAIHLTFTNFRTTNTHWHYNDTILTYLMCHVIVFVTLLKLKILSHIFYVFCLFISSKIFRKLKTLFIINFYPKPSVQEKIQLWLCAFKSRLVFKDLQMPYLGVDNFEWFW